MRRLLTCLFICACSLSHAQDFSYGKLKDADFDQNSPLVDSSSSGIVLNEYGHANIELSPISGKGFEIEYYYHVLIKILNKEGYEQANFTVPLYVDNQLRETLIDVKGITYNMEGGKLVKTDLAKENVITEKTSKSLNQVKIVFPQVKEGSIIELRYKTKSPFLFNLDAWPFQTDIPKMRSEFVTRIPEICTYKVKLRGGLSLTDKKIENYNTKLETQVGEVRGQKTAYLMENVPAFISEDYMTASKNFRSLLSFELARYSIPFGPSRTFSMTWRDVQTSLIESEDFGGQIKRKNQLKEFIDPIITPDMDELAKARSIYDFFKSRIKWNKRHSVFADVGVKKALETRVGNSADINLGLVNALNYVNIEAEPIILSTRDNGIAGLYSPGISDFNHVIARAKIGEQYILLDASSIYEPFGNLPFKCINYQGRNIPFEGVSDWVSLEAKLISTFQVNFEGEVEESGSLKGKLNIYRGGYGASDKRAQMDRFNSIEEYYEDYTKRFSNMSLLEPKVEHKDNPEMLLMEQMEMEMTDFALMDGNELTFNPIVFGRTETNPFNLSERTYPVDLGSKIQENFTFKIKIPKGFVLKEGMKSSQINMALPNRDARFVYTFDQEEDVLTVQVLSQLNKPFFMPEEYFDLKEFFSRIIQGCKTHLVFEKA